MPLLTVPSGAVAFDLPDGAEFDDAPGPAFGRIDFGGDRLVFYDLLVIDVSDVPDDEVAPLALHQALDAGEAIGAVLSNHDDLFRDALMIEVKRGWLRRKGRWFLRLDRLPGGLVRILKIAPGRMDGESKAERAEMDALGLLVANAVRFAPEPTAFDLAAGKPGSTQLRLRDRLFCPLPEGWTAHRPDEVDPNLEPDPDDDADYPSSVVCLAPDETASMFVAVISFVGDEPVDRAELAETLAGVREDDMAAVRSLWGMGAHVEAVDLGPGRYVVHGAFDPEKLGFAGRHYSFRTVSATHMTTATFSPLVTDDRMPPEEAASLLAEIDRRVMRAFLFADGLD